MRALMGEEDPVLVTQMQQVERTNAFIKRLRECGVPKPPAQESNYV